MFSSQNSQVSSAANYIEDVFSTYLYTGNGSTSTIANGIDLTKGGLVWVKNRGSAQNHVLADTARGDDNYLSSNTTSAATSGGGIYMGDGFAAISSSALTNASSNTYASWTFRKQPKFFDVVTYTGNGASSQTISHNLGSEPGCIIVKCTSNTNNWYVYHRGLATPNNMNLLLNLTNARTNNGVNVWNVTSTTFEANLADLDSNVNGATYVAYLFAHNAGGFGLTGTDNVISCGSYTGNGSTSGLSITLGYEPQWILIKNATDAGPNWAMFDNMRGIATGGTEQRLYANTSGAEATTSGNDIDLTATGFDIKTDLGYLNTSGSTYIYIAIRRGPMKVPTSGTSVYATDTAGGTTPNPPLYNSGWPVDLGWYRGNMPNAASNDWYDRLRGQTQTLITNSTDQEQAYGGGNYSFDSNTGWSTQSFVQSDYRAWMFRRAPSFFDEVCYTGNGSTQTITHNLTVVPELIIAKNRGQAGNNWPVLFNFASTTMNYGFLNLTNSCPNDTYANVGVFSAAPTSTSMFLTNSSSMNASGYGIVAYLFATCAGVSKVGSYTGTGTTLQVDCGFTGGARFVLIKRTDSTGDWYVWDSARGIVSGNDPYLLLNSTAAEVTNTDYVDTYSAGFEISSTAPAAINASGGTFIFLAIA